MPQPPLRQQSGYNDMPLLQQHIMFKQLQELQRQQQLQQFGDARQQNSVNQISMITKQATGGQFPPLINGTPIHDASQIFMNRMPRGASPSAQGVPNGLLFSQEQGQALRSLGLSPQQLDVSLYGTPIASARANLSQSSYLQGISYDSTNSLTKAGINQPQKPVMHLSAFSNSLLGDQCAISQEQVCMPDGAFTPKQGYQGRNFFGQVPLQGLNSVLSETFEHGNTLQRNVSVQEFNGRQEQAGLPGLLPEKATQVGSSPGLVTLDPMEQKILFSMDDNVWDDSFGKSTDMGTGSFGNALEHPDHLNVFPYIQSGSYSALMQSAVAEASSSDTGLQEEWSGLTFQNTEMSTDNQPSNFVDSGKEQTGWADNNLQSASSLCSKPSPVFNDSSLGSSFPGFQQSGAHFSLEQRGGLHLDSSHESIQQSPKNDGRWLDSDPQQKSPIVGSQQVQTLMHLENAWNGQIYEHSESNAHQQGISSYNSGSQPCNKPKGRVIEPLTPCGNTTLNSVDNGKTMDHCWMGDISGAVYNERDLDSCIWKTDGNCGASSFSNSTGGLEVGQSGTDNTLVNREDSQLNNFAAVSNSSMTKANQETSEQVPDSHQLDYMKHVDVSVKHKGNKMGKYQHQQGNGPQILDHSYKGADGMFENQQNCYQKDNSSNDSYNSNSSQHAITGREVRENVWLNASDSQSVTGVSEKSSGQVGQKAPTSPRFFIHTVGNLGVNAEPADTIKHVAYLQVLCQQVSHGLRSHGQGYFGQFKSIVNVPNNAMGLEKGPLPDFQGIVKASEEVPSRHTPGSDISASLDRLVGFYGSGVTAQTRVDQSGEGSTATHFLSQVPEEQNPQASVARPYNQSYASQRSALRLAPPLQQLPNSNRNLSSQGSPQTGINSSHFVVQENSPAAVTSGASYLRNQLHGQLMANASVVCQSSPATLPGTVSRLPPFNLAHSQDPSQLISPHPFGQHFPVLEAVPVSQPSIMSGMPQQGRFSVRPPNVWTNVPAQQHLSATELHKVPSTLLSSMDPSNNGLESRSWPPQELNDQNLQKGGNGSLGFGAYSLNSKGYNYGEEQPGKERSQRQTLSETFDPAAQTGSFVQGKEYLAKHLSVADAAASGSLVNHLSQQDLNGLQHVGNQNPALSRRDFDAFNRSLKGSLDFHQNYSLLHQVQAMNNVDSDPSKMVSKTCNGANSVLDVQQATAMAGQQSLNQHTTRVGYPMDNELNVASRLNSFRLGDAQMQNLMSGARVVQTGKASSELILQGLPSQEMVTFGRNDSQSHSNNTQTASNQMENSQISLQMAPSWFKQYGTFKNGQMLQMYDARTARSAAEAVSFGKPSEYLGIHSSVERANAADASHIGSVWPSTAATLVGSEHLLTPYILPSDVNDQSLAVVRPKKRKTATSVLLSWHKEVTQGSHAIQNISMAEEEWAQVTNRLVEKIEDGADMIEDGLPMVRPKRRLIMTTQLMQQLLRPAPAAILSADATSDHDCVAFSVARLALGDACSLASCIRSDSCSTMTSEKLKTSERIDNHYFSKVVEEFTDRAKKLENDLSRLDRTVSILDIRLECQELEKYSVINRFAKFHTRVQTDATETSSSSGTAVTAPKTFLQKYVIALPMPRKLPEQMHCLSL